MSEIYTINTRGVPDRQSLRLHLYLLQRREPSRNSQCGMHGIRDEGIGSRSGCIRLGNKSSLGSHENTCCMVMMKKEGFFAGYQNISWRKIGAFTGSARILWVFGVASGRRDVATPILVHSRYLCIVVKFLRLYVGLTCRGLRQESSTSTNTTCKISRKQDRTRVVKKYLV